MKEELNVLVQAQYPLIYLVTSEEERAEQTIASIAQIKPLRRVFVWTVTHGIVEYGQPRRSARSHDPAIGMRDWLANERDAVPAAWP